MAQRVAIRLGAVRTAVKESAAVKLRQGDEQGADLHMTSRVRVCRICTQNEARYTCPKCNAAYCSVGCYKTHGESCTEQFYETHVRSEMTLTQKSKDSGGDAADERQMQELLERAKQFQEQATAGDAQAMALAARLEQLAMMDESELSLDCLTPEERAQFLSEVADGRLSQFVALWRPWWLRDPRQYEQESAALRRQATLIEEIGSNSDEEQEDEDEEGEDVAELLKIESRTLPVALFTNEQAESMPLNLKSLLPPGSTGPSPLLRLHLVEILFSYAMVMRTFNGDWEQDAEDAALMLLQLCQVLGQDAKFETMAHVLHACKLKRVDNSVTAKTAEPVESHRLALSDVRALLTSRTFVLDALSDMRQLVASYRQALLSRSGNDESAQRRAPSTSKSVTKQHKRTTKAAARRMDGVERKLRFYLIWAFRCDPLDLSDVAAQIVAT